MWIAVIWLRIQQAMVNTLKEPSGSIKCREFLNYVMAHQNFPQNVKDNVCTLL